MKTVKNVKQEITILKDKIVRCRTVGDIKQATRFVKELHHLEECVLYLETKPTVEFIDKEIQRLGNIISKRGAEIETYFNAKSFQKMTKGELSKLVKKKVLEYDLPRHKKHLETLVYLSKK